MATNTITIEIDFYINWDESIFLTKEEFEEHRAHEIQDLIDDNAEMEEWINDTFTAYDLYLNPDLLNPSSVKAQWEKRCEQEWEDCYGNEWECITKIIEVKVS